jgi:hypothetical protein
MKQTLFTGWHFMRWLRLVLGIIIAIQAIQMREAMSGFIAAFFLFQAIANVGCCGVTNCAVPVSNKRTEGIQDIVFSEVKSK